MLKIMLILGQVLHQNDTFLSSKKFLFFWFFIFYFLDFTFFVPDFFDFYFFYFFCPGILGKWLFLACLWTKFPKMYLFRFFYAQLFFPPKNPRLCSKLGRAQSAGAYTKAVRGKLCTLYITYTIKYAFNTIVYSILLI